MISPVRRRATGLVRAAARLWKPTGPADPQAGVAAGVALTIPLLAGIRLGYPEFGASMTLPVILIAMPLDAADRGERARILAARTVSLTVAGIVVWLIGTHTWLLVAAVTCAAVAGVFLPRVGMTAALGVLLIGITGTGIHPVIPGVAQLAGSLWASALLLPRWGRPPESYSTRTGPDTSPLRSQPARRHAGRLGLLVAAAASALAGIDHLAGQAHWLITSLLLTLRPTTAATRTRAVQRVTGNSLGGILTALVLLTGPGPIAVALIVGCTGALAYGARPANYLYWALATPLLLLLLSDFSEPMPWYGAATRASLNLLGGLLALAATRWLWPQPVAGQAVGPPVVGEA